MFQRATFLEDAAQVDCTVEPARAEQSQTMDDRSFEDFYAETARPLWSYICRVSGSHALADDLLQESFFRLWRAAVPFMNEQQRKAYLYKIATNLIHTHWRKIKHERLWQLHTTPRDESTTEMTGEQLLTPDIARIFQTLKPQQRALLWLAYVEGYEHAEIARVLELREKSVRVLLFRARHKLASILKEKGLDA